MDLKRPVELLNVFYLEKEVKLILKWGTDFFFGKIKLIFHFQFKHTDYIKICKYCRGAKDYGLHQQAFYIEKCCLH